MNVRFFIINLSSIMVLDLDIMISTLLNSHGLINITHLSLAIEIDVIPLTFFCRVRPHVFIIDKKTQSSSRSNSHKLPISLYGGSKLQIDVINEANALRTLVYEYLSPTVDSEIFLLNKFERMPVGLFVTVISLYDNELLMTKIPAVAGTIILKVDMKLTTTTA